MRDYPGDGTAGRGVEVCGVNEASVTDRKTKEKGKGLLRKLLKY